MAKTVVGLFSHLSEAQNTVNHLVEIGVPRGSVSLVAHSRESEWPTTPMDADATAAPGYSTIEPDLTDGVATGAESGAIIGGAAGLFFGLMTFMIPGIGPVVAAGTLGAAIAAGLTGAGTGAIAGGLLGGLVSSGIPEHHARHYEESVRQGGALVVVHAEDTDAQDIAKTMYDSGAIDIEGNTQENHFMEEHQMSDLSRSTTEDDLPVASTEENGIAESTYSLPTAQPTDGTTSATTDHSNTLAPSILGAANASPSPAFGENGNTAERHPAVAASIVGENSGFPPDTAVKVGRTDGPTISGASSDNPNNVQDLVEDAITKTPPLESRKRGARVYDSRTTLDGTWLSSTDEVFDKETAEVLDRAA